MQRKKITLIVVLSLMISIGLILQSVDLVNANYYPPPSIEISSPIGAPRIYRENSVPLHVNVNVLANEPDITSIKYSLDGKANVTLTDLARTDDVAYWTTTKGVFIKGTAFRAETSLDNLAEGKHTITVYSHDANGKEMSESREFTVDYDYTQAQPTLPGLQNGTGTQTPSTTQTETPPSTINTGPVDAYSFQLLENPILIIGLAGAVILVLLAIIIIFKKKLQASKDSSIS